MEKKTNNVETVMTADGSVTFRLPEMDETYHSVHGAVQESRHVFIEMGLKPLLDRKSGINILEMGFGTGLNALLTFLEAEKNQSPVAYYSLEKFPLTPLQYAQLNYAELLNAKNQWRQIVDTGWDEVTAINAYFSLQKISSGLETFVTNLKFDLIYYDAFAPRVQPELWTVEVFDKLSSLLVPEGKIVTYCAKGEVKRNFKAAGFVVETLPGPPGKREMIRATAGY